MINGHGNNIYEYGNSIKADFSSNIAFNHKSDILIEYLHSKLSCINNYPDPNAKVLTRKIAKHHNIDTHSVLVTNGSAEAFYLIAHLLQNSKTAICIPSFAEYEDACLLYKHDLEFIPIGKFATHNFSLYNSVWLGNPNNPNGYITPPELIMEQCKKNRKTFFVIDEAYCDLCSKEKIETISNLENLIVIKSLTKAFAVPGIRLGYIIARSNIIEKLSTRRPPWSVNSLSLETGAYVMDNYSELIPSIAQLSEASLFLQKKIATIAQIEVTASSCNFFLSKLKNGKASELKEYLIQNHGILIRDASNFRGLDHSFFRVAAQQHIKNQDLVKAIEIFANNRL